MHPGGASFLFKLPVHGRGSGFIGIFVYLDNLHTEAALTESNFNHIAHLNLVGGLHLSAVYADTFGIAGIVCHASALYKARYFKVLIKSHVVSPKNPKTVVTKPLSFS